MRHFIFSEQKGQLRRPLTCLPSGSPRRQQRENGPYFNILRAEMPRAVFHPLKAGIANAIPA